MSIKLFKNVRINHKKLILLMRFVVLTGICDLTILSVLAVCRLFIDFTALLSSITENGIGISIFGSLVFAFVFSVLLFSVKDSQFTNVVEFGEIEGIPSYIILLEECVVLLLCCLLFIPFELSGLAVFNEYFLVIGIILFMISGLFGSMVYLLVVPLIMGKYDTKIYYKLNIAKNIFHNYIINDKKDSCAITEFLKYFRESITDIDRQLPNGVKIDDFKKNSKGSVKNAIIHYLPIYIKFGNESDIEALQKHIGKMSKLIDKNSNNITSLEIVSPILDIYIEIENFIESNHYSIQSQHRRRIITCFTSACALVTLPLALMTIAVTILMVLQTHTPITIYPIHNVLNVSVMLVKEEYLNKLSMYQISVIVITAIPVVLTIIGKIRAYLVKKISVS